MLAPGTLVIAHLTSPAEKFWGVLQGLDATGLVLRGISVSSFDDWTYQIARGESQALDLATMFVPLARVERIFLDEQVGEVESYGQRFAKRVGQPVESFLGVSPAAGGEIPS